MKVLGPIFSGISALLIVGIILSRFIHFIIVCSVGTVLIFLSLGVIFCVLGYRNIKKAKADCTAADEGKNSDPGFLLRMGVIWLVCTFFIILILAVTMIFVIPMM